MSKKNFLEFRSDMDYAKALRYQGVLNSEGYTGLFAFSCNPTITLGLGSKVEEEVLVGPKSLKERNVSLLETDRGGKATYHGPGQLVGFPLIDLRNTYRDGRAVRRFSEDLLMGLAHACAALGVKSVQTKKGFPGVWTNRGKLASIGITVKNGFIFHGFSLNVTRECYTGFSLIEPCGISDCPITSLEEEGLSVECNEELSRMLAPYLSNLFSSEKTEESTIMRFERKHKDLVTKVSRSSMAIDYVCSSLSSQD